VVSLTVTMLVQDVITESGRYPGSLCGHSASLPTMHLLAIASSPWSSRKDLPVLAVFRVPPYLGRLLAGITWLATTA
jgi:hypothetical protein